MDRKTYSVRYTRITKCEENVSVNIPEADVEKLKGMTDAERAEYLDKAYWGTGGGTEFYDPNVEYECVLDELARPHNFSLIEWIDGRAEKETALPTNQEEE